MIQPINMAGPRICQSFCHNSCPTGKDEGVGRALKALTDGNNTSTLTFAVSCAPTFTFASVSAPFSNNELFKQFIKTYFGVQTQLALSKV